MLLTSCSGQQANPVNAIVDDCGIPESAIIDDGESDHTVLFAIGDGAGDVTADEAMCVYNAVDPDATLSVQFSSWMSAADDSLFEGFIGDYRVGAMTLAGWVVMGYTYIPMTSENDRAEWGERP